tara:strand:+ start:570 stop:788 length:219 start_codon:yes stop_codon:yes gene_type:complete
MGELIDLKSYKEEKQDNEIAALKAELAKLMEEIGVEAVPMMLMSESGISSNLGLSFSIPNGYESYDLKKDEE